MDRLDTLRDRHPEWEPWLGLLRRTRRAIADPAWAAHVTPGSLTACPGDEQPRLAGARLAADDRLARRFIHDLLATAARSAGEMAVLATAVRERSVDAMTLIEASLNEDGERVESMARELGVAAAPLQAIVSLAAMPLLHACRQAGAGTPPAYARRVCPTCGAWPALAELRGLERRRHLRCARCGDDWETTWLSCPFCGEREHARLGALVPEATRETRRVETCATCRGYVKTIATLTPTDGPEIMVEDLLSVDLDVAALQHGYARPAAPPRRLDARIVAAPRVSRRLFAWR